MAGISYSTSEQDTGVLWVDGKSIFQITVETPLSGLDPPPDTELFDHGVSIETLIDVFSTFQNNPATPTQYLPGPRSGTSAAAPCAGTGTQTVDLDVIVSPTQIQISSIFSYVPWLIGHTTLRYTQPT